jgi:hypothetical protein
MQTHSATLEAPLSDLYTYNEPRQIANEQELSVRQIGHYVGKVKFRETGYNTTTFGHIGFTHVETQHVTEDILLQARLDILCDKLRAKY